MKGGFTMLYSGFIIRTLKPKVEWYFESPSGLIRRCTDESDAIKEVGKLISIRTADNEGFCASTELASGSFFTVTYISTEDYRVCTSHILVDSIETRVWTD